MDHKKTKVESSTITYHRDLVEKKTNNIYEAITIIAKRSEQINAKRKKEISEKLETFVTTNDKGLEEIFENKEQIEFSKLYEKLPKPHSIAIKEWLDGDLHYEEKVDSDTEN